MALDLGAEHADSAGDEPGGAVGVVAGASAGDQPGPAPEVFERARRPTALDEWGYPLVDPRPIPPELEAHAGRAVDACPTLALLVRLEALAGG